MIYMGWMVMDMKAPLPENIRKALEHYEKKYGKAPSLVEHGMKVEMPKVDGVRYKSIQIPANTLFITND